MSRRISRRKRLSITIAGTGIALGVATVLLWPRIKQLLLSYSLTVGKPTLKSSRETIAALLE